MHWVLTSNHPHSFIESPWPLDKIIYIAQLVPISRLYVSSGWQVAFPAFPMLMGSATINHALYLVVSHLRPAPRHRAARSLFQTVSTLIAPFLDQSPLFFLLSLMYIDYIRYI